VPCAGGSCLFVLGVEWGVLKLGRRGLIGRWSGGPVASVVEECVHPEHQGGGDLRGAQHTVLVQGGQQQFLSRAQYLGGFPPGVGGVGDGRNQSRPRRVGEDP